MNEIPQGIAVLLKSRMQEEGKTMAEFSEELGVSRSTLQNLMRGENALRTDTVELIAGKLDIPLGELISGKPAGRQMTLRAAMALLLSEVQAIPEPFHTAATAMLHCLEEAIRLNKVTHMDTGYLNYCSRDDTYRYFVHESCFGPRYGLVAKQNMGNWTTVALTPGFSDDLGSVLMLARDCTKAQLPPEKLIEVVGDFLLQMN